MHPKSKSYQDSEPLLPVASRSSSSANVDQGASFSSYPLNERNNHPSDDNYYDNPEADSFTNSNNNHSRSRSASPPPYKASFNRHISSSLDSLAASRQSSKSKSKRSPPDMARYRRRCSVTVIALLLTGFLFCAWIFFSLPNEDPQVRVEDETDVTGESFTTSTITTTEPSPLRPTTTNDDQSKAVDPSDSELTYPKYVLGPPTASFRDNLRPDMNYITAWINAGWTNDFMTYVNLVYLALLTNRTAILGPFAPSHIGGSAGIIPLGEVFDVPRLNKLLNHPVVEWRDVKMANVTDDTPREPIGCWSAWAAAEREGRPRGTPLDNVLKLDMSYTPAPKYSKLTPEGDPDVHVTFWSLASLAYPMGRSRANLPDHAPFPGPVSGHTTLPEEHLVCYDFTYFVSALFGYEWEQDYSPAWRFVATHFHWTQRLVDITNSYLKRTFGISEHEDVPPYIALHIRHGDFSMQCWNAENKNECFAPLSTYAKRVDEIRAELREKQGIDVQPNHVIVTSDEPDPGWWEEVKAQGWTWINHSEAKTEEVYGKWYTVFIDAVAQSSGRGFVGTSGSTMSLVAQRRCEDWHNGVTRSVRWGWKDADVHR